MASGTKYPGRRTPSLAARLWSKVNYGPGCWTWLRATDGHGYGVIGLRGGGVAKAHRIAYMLAKGPIPEGLDILHSCDNPPCVRPDHLRPGTARDNAQDMVSRGRHFTPFKGPNRPIRPKKPSCVRGHLYDTSNTRVDDRGYRHCRTCAREKTRLHRQRLAMAVAS